MHTNSFTLNFINSEGTSRVTIEDDGRVAYAYFIKQTSIVGDVWLYNRCDTPIRPEWRDARRPPFALSAEFAEADAVLSPLATDINVRWRAGESHCIVLIRGRLRAILGDGMKPGRCVAAKKDSPIALKLLPDDLAGER